jgi:hypothetical protein
VDATIVVPSASDYVEAACKAAGRRIVNRNASWFIARMVDSTGKPAGDVAWHAWFRTRNVRTGETSGSADWQPIDDAGGSTSSDGLAQYCGSALHVGDSVLIEARMSKKGPPLVGVIELAAPITAVRIKLLPGAPISSPR